MIKFLILLLGFAMAVEDSIIFVSPSFLCGKDYNPVIVHVTANDAKVIGSGVGGAFVRIKNLETGEVLAQGKHLGGTGETDRIMVRPHRRGE